jgi:intermembrane space import and assembly protein 40
MSDLTVHMRLAPKKQPTLAKPPRPSDAPTPSAPRSDASEPVTISSEGEEPLPASSETPIEGDGAQGESSGGAFNPETGEINWDCPCLGGMAHGPCGQQFRDAFSCFVYSEADPKGIDCVEKFKAMQDCFREHPDVYGDGMWIYLESMPLYHFRRRNHGRRR